MPAPRDGSAGEHRQCCGFRVMTWFGVAILPQAQSTPKMSPTTPAFWPWSAAPFTIYTLRTRRVALPTLKPLQNPSLNSGLYPLLSLLYMIMAMPICRMFERHWVFRASSRARPSAGSRSPTSKAMMTITTRSSIRVNAFLDIRFR